MERMAGSSEVEAESTGAGVQSRRAEGRWRRNLDRVVATRAVELGGPAAVQRGRGVNAPAQAPALADWGDAPLASLHQVHPLALGWTWSWSHFPKWPL